jgi:hypothetical protein
MNAQLGITDFRAFKTGWAIVIVGAWRRTEGKPRFVARYRAHPIVALTIIVTTTANGDSSH